MRTAMIVAMVMMAATVRADERKVTVCVSGVDSHPGLQMVSTAEVVANRIFAAAALKIDWKNRERNCPSDAIRVRFQSNTPANWKPGALAYAQPYDEGKHIWVFNDRIMETSTAQAQLILGHVLAHEIVHILEGVCRHSATGLMKARWETTDFMRMGIRPMRFDAADLTLINLFFANAAARKDVQRDTAKAEDSGKAVAGL